MTFRRLVLVVSVALILPSAPRMAVAQVSDADKASARELAVVGFEALDRKDSATAADSFSRADALFHAPTVGLGLARARAGLGQLVAAQEAYRRVVFSDIPADASAAFKQAVQDAQRELASLAPRVPGLTIVVTGAPSAKVTIDDVEVPSAALGTRRALDPGTHLVRAGAPGFAMAEARVTLAEGETKQLPLALKPGDGALPESARSAASASPAASQSAPSLGTEQETGSSSSPLRTSAFVSLAVGGAGLIVGGVAGGLALGKHSDILSQCPGGSCPSNAGPSLRSDVDSFHTMGMVSTVGFVAGVRSQPRVSFC